MNKDFIRDEVTAMDVGYDVGLGYKFGHGEGVNLSLRFSQGFVNTLKEQIFLPDMKKSIELTEPLPNNWLDHLAELLADTM